MPADMVLNVEQRLKPLLYKTRLRGLKTVKITLFSSVRGGRLRLCRRGFNRRLIFVCVDAVSTAVLSYL